MGVVGVFIVNHTKKYVVVDVVPENVVNKVLAELDIGDKLYGAFGDWDDWIQSDVIPEFEEKGYKIYSGISNEIQGDATVSGIAKTVDGAYMVISRESLRKLAQKLLDEENELEEFDVKVVEKT